MEGVGKEFKDELADFLKGYGKKVDAAQGAFIVKGKKTPKVVKQLERLTLTQLVEFVEKCKNKYIKVCLLCYSNTPGYLLKFFL